MDLQGCGDIDWIDLAQDMGTDGGHLRMR